jgi:Leucine-rich repeat (LRR) protein
LAVIESPYLKSLTTLNLGYIELGDTGAYAIARSTSILPCLTSLNLAHNGLTIAGAGALATAPQLQNLTSLNLSDNALSKDERLEIAIHKIRTTHFR